MAPARINAPSAQFVAHALFYVTALGSCFDASARANDALSFPYVAYVSEDRAAVRSGPAETFYATLDLSRGFAVEVYRHDPGGWAAVRPPEGSFSLAPAESVSIVAPRVAEVVIEGTPVRVGSRLSGEMSAVQVKLMRGERVEVLAPPQPGQPHVQIAPPAGEFRWVALAQLSRDPPMEQAVRRIDQSSTWRAYGAPRPVDEPPVVLEEIEADEEAVAIPLPDVVAARPTRLAPAQLNSPIEIVPGSPAAIEPTRYETQESQSADRPAAPATSQPVAVAPPAEPNTASGPTATLGPSSASSPRPRIRFHGPAVRSSEPASLRVAELQLDLSRLIVAPPEPWLLAGLREEAAGALAEAETATEREQLRELLARIVLLEEIANQRSLLAAASDAATDRSGDAGDRKASQSRGTAAAQLSATAEPLDVFDAQAAAAGQASPTAQTDEIRAMIRSDLGLSGKPVGAGDASSSRADVPRYAGTEARYDAVGTLKPVVSRRSSAPQFALIDDEGQIASLITPAPEVNLQGFVGQRVGVVGSRGYMPEYRRAHVTATHVTPLDAGGTLRR